jgi:hypothetical protein
MAAKKKSKALVKAWDRNGLPARRARLTMQGHHEITATEFEAERARRPGIGVNPAYRRVA